MLGLNSVRKIFFGVACCSATDIEDRDYAGEMSGGMVSTNPADIDGFMRLVTGKKVFFSTYQSLPSVINARVKFDILFQMKRIELLD